MVSRSRALTSTIKTDYLRAAVKFSGLALKVDLRCVVLTKGCEVVAIECGDIAAKVRVGYGSEPSRRPASVGGA